MVHLIQLLCPQRHCVIATAFDSSEYSDAEALALISDDWNRLVSSDSFDPWCGICMSRDLKFEVKPTAFATLEEAAEPMRRVEEDQIRSRLAVEATRRAKN